jgi:hypothetical protein
MRLSSLFFVAVAAMLLLRLCYWAVTFAAGVALSRSVLSALDWATLAYLIIGFVVYFRRDRE